MLIGDVERKYLENHVKEREGRYERCDGLRGSFIIGVGNRENQTSGMFGFTSFSIHSFALIMLTKDLDILEQTTLSYIIPPASS